LIVVVAGRVSTGPVDGVVVVAGGCDVDVCPAVDVDDWAEADAAPAMTMAAATATRLNIRSAS
jgi:hypothetical protein